jgi:hypothetical protein
VEVAKLTALLAVCCCLLQAELAAGCSFTLTSETLGAGTYQQRSCQVGSNLKVKIEFFSADDTMGFYIGDEPAGADGSLVYFRGGFMTRLLVTLMT